DAWPRDPAPYLKRGTYRLCGQADRWAKIEADAAAPQGNAGCFPRPLWLAQSEAFGRPDHRGRSSDSKPGPFPRRTPRARVRGAGRSWVEARVAGPLSARVLRRT